MVVALLIAGAVLYFIGAVWLTYQAWSNDAPLLAVGIFLLAPIFGTVYVLQHFDEAKVPYAVMILGLVLRIAGLVLA